jgi:hypothetical protein
MKKLIIILSLIAFIGCEKDSETAASNKKCNCGKVKSKDIKTLPGQHSTYNVENYCTGNMGSFRINPNDEVGIGGEYCNSMGEW